MRTARRSYEGWRAVTMHCDALRRLRLSLEPANRRSSDTTIVKVRDLQEVLDMMSLHNNCFQLDDSQGDDTIR